MFATGGRGALRPARPKSARPVTETGGPFKGMKTTMNGSVDPQFAEWLHNCYPMNPYSGSELVVRPGRRPYPIPHTDSTLKHGLPGVAGDVQLDVNSFQMFSVFTGSTSSNHHRLVAIVDGKFYATRTGVFPDYGWTEALNAAYLSGVGITLQANTLHYAVMFNGKMIVVCANGSGYAFSWDGTQNAGVVKLTNAGTSFYGRPVVYAGKLFFIRSTRKTIVWSEEGDETTGYEAGGFNNAWDLRQTSQELLTALVATNEALYFFRRSSIGAIYGGSAQDFQTSATMDSVSSTIGTNTPSSPIVAGNAIWFLDQQGRPCYFLLGSNEIVPVWHEIERAYTLYAQDGIGYDRLAEPNAETASFMGFEPMLVYYPALDMVFIPFAYATTILSFIPWFDGVVAFNATTKRAQTVWTFPTRFMGIAVSRDTEYVTPADAFCILDAFGWSYAILPTVFGSLDFSLANFDPGAWYTDRTDLTDQTDEGITNGMDVRASCIGPRHFMAVDAELRAIRLDIEYIGWRSGSTMGVRWATPTTMLAGGADEWNEPDGNAGGTSVSIPTATVTLEGLATDPSDSVPVIHGHAEVGLDEIGRWIVFAFSWKGQASRARLVRWQVEAVVEGRQREAR